MRDLYEILGVKRDASPAEIKAAYRSGSKKLHPDMNEGKESQEWLDFQNAYDLLSVPADRKFYDETGSTQRIDPKMILDKVAEQLAENFVKMTEGLPNWETLNITDLMAQLLQELRIDIVKNIEKSERTINGIEKLSARLSLKAVSSEEGKEPLILKHLSIKIKALSLAKALQLKNLEIHDIAVSMLNEYEFEAAPSPSYSGYHKNPASPGPMPIFNLQFR